MESNKISRIEGIPPLVLPESRHRKPYDDIANYELTAQKNNFSEKKNTFALTISIIF